MPAIKMTHVILCIKIVFFSRFLELLFLIFLFPILKKKKTLQAAARGEVVDEG